MYQNKARKMEGSYSFEITKEFIIAAEKKDLYKIMYILRNNISDIDISFAIRECPQIFELTFYKDEKNTLENEKKIIQKYAEITETMERMDRCLETLNKSIKDKRCTWNKSGLIEEVIRLFENFYGELERKCVSKELFKEKLKEFLKTLFISACERNFNLEIIRHMFERYTEEMIGVDLDKGYEIACKNRNRDLIVYFINHHLE